MMSLLPQIRGQYDKLDSLMCVGCVSRRKRTSFSGNSGGLDNLVCVGCVLHPEMDEFFLVIPEVVLSQDVSLD